MYLLEDIQAWEDAETQEAVLEARDTILSEYNQAHGRDPTTAQHRTAPVSTATTATVKDVALLRLSDLPVDDAADDARLQLGLSCSPIQTHTLSRMIFSLLLLCVAPCTASLFVGEAAIVGDSIVVDVAQWVAGEDEVGVTMNTCIA